MFCHNFLKLKHDINAWQSDDVFQLIPKHVLKHVTSEFCYAHGSESPAEKRSIALL